MYPRTLSSETVSNPKCSAAPQFVYLIQHIGAPQFVYLIQQQEGVPRQLAVRKGEQQRQLEGQQQWAPVREQWEEHGLGEQQLAVREQRAVREQW